MLLPALEQLAATPDMLRGLMAGLGEDDVNWKPAPNRFSIAEVLEHLSHVEGHCFRLRVDESMERDGAPWEPYDPEVYIAAGQYSGRNAEDSFDHFEEQREDNVAWLRNLPEDAARRTGVHAKLGVITLEQLLNEWAFHDLGHIRQIAELVRARKYYPHMGAFQSQYKIDP
jgi:hypothetical protein